MNQIKSWHALEISEVALCFNVDLSNGLTLQEAATRLASVGINRIEGQPSRSPILLF
ncbi:cation-transporting P-type ATPase [Legionella bozemanae]|nr:cation-transporting P-type ATPase [Legionella bozemanae]